MEIEVDPLLLFQRLTTVMQSSDDLELAFKHELCSYPPVLFDSSLLLLEADKPAIADALWKVCENQVPAYIPDDGIQYVLDGGALLQRIPWSHGFTYGDIYCQHIEHVARKYKDAVVVFDGYENMSTKDMTHWRRSKGKARGTMMVAASMITTMKKDQFLANQKNKLQFIFMLSVELDKSNCKTYHASGDADLLMVQKAVQSAATSTTVLVGDNTDLIVLLYCHASLDSHDLFFSPEPKKNKKSFASGTSELQKKSLAKTSATIFFSSMPFLGVTQHHIFMGLGRGHPLANLEQVVYSMSKQKCFILIQPPNMM